MTEQEIKGKLKEFFTNNLGVDASELKMTLCYSVTELV